MGRTCRGLRTAIRYLHNIPHKLSSPPRNAPRRRRPAAGSARKAKAAARRGCRWSGRSTLLDPMKEEEGGRGCRAGAAARLRGRGTPACAAKRPPAPGRAGGGLSPLRRPGSPQAPRQRLRPGRRASTSRRRSARCSRSRGRSSSPPACAGAAHAGPACS